MIAPALIEKKYYTYELSFPEGFVEDGIDLSNVVFYVGKGTTKDANKRQRIDQHEADARHGECTRCCKAIRRVWKRGLQIQKSIVFQTDMERDALLYEWADIHIIHASTHLTNLVGNSYEYERRKKIEEEAWQKWRAMSNEEKKLALELARQR